MLPRVPALESLVTRTFSKSGERFRSTFALLRLPSQVEVTLPSTVSRRTVEGRADRGRADRQSDNRQGDQGKQSPSTHGQLLRMQGIRPQEGGIANVAQRGNDEVATKVWILLTDFVA